MAYEQIFAAAGTPNAVFGLSPQELVSLTQGQSMVMNALRLS
jgi:prolyl-tRNA editing enzyme YbaK/EbsC (Cys-tRNA(Pro) deacylase)